MADQLSMRCWMSGDAFFGALARCSLVSPAETQN